VDAVIAYNIAGVPTKDRICAPPAPRSFAGQLVVGDAYRNDPQVKKLIKVFFDPASSRICARPTTPARRNS
jgi:D-methionine transport system substrate-binding protein